jgi:hypothetical protein
MTMRSDHRSLQPPLAPRNGRTLMVLGIARISTEQQDKRSLDDQVAKMREYVSHAFAGPIEWEFIRSQGSGEYLDRQEFYRAEEIIESGAKDLVVAEDLARICRRKRAYDFCELCVDHDTRLIAINDRVDTAQKGWEDSAFIATWHHERSNRDTSDRIRRTLRSRFSLGGVFQCAIFGYIKAPGARGEADVSKDPAAGLIYDEWFRRLEDGHTFATVADWLNAQGVPTGSHCRTKLWTGTMVGRITRNPILKGLRIRNDKITRRINKTGRRRCVKAPPEERLERYCPHLAFIEPGRYDRLIALLDERNAKFRRTGVNGIDTRKNVPKKRTVWPGQHIDCGVCGRPFVYGGHGQRDHLMCRGAHEYRCWNGISVDGPLAAEKMIATIRTAIAALPDYDQQLMGLVQEEMQRWHGDKDRQQRELTRRRAAVEHEIQNLIVAVRAAGHSPSLLEELQRLEKQKNQIAWEQGELAKAGDEPPALPDIAAVRELVEEVFAKLAVTSPEFGGLLRRLIPRIIVDPYRLCDGGKAVLRARFTFDLVPLLPRASRLGPLAEALRRSLVVDLYDPPQREAYRVPVMELTANGLKQREIAWELDITQTAVQHAAAVGRRMEQLGTRDAYLPLTAPPVDDDRLRRHRHPRYRFEPLAQVAEQARST